MEGAGFSWVTRLLMDNLSLQVLESEVKFCDLHRQSAQYQKDKLPLLLTHCLLVSPCLSVCSTCLILIVNICTDVSEQDPFWSVLVQQAEEQGCNSCLNFLDITQLELAAITIDCSAHNIGNCV